MRCPEVVDEEGRERRKRRAYRDARLAPFRSHQICTDTARETRLERAHRANPQRQGSNLQKTGGVCPDWVPHGNSQMSVRPHTHTHNRRGNWVGGWVGVKIHVRREQHHTRTHNTHLIAYSSVPRIHHRLQRPETALAYAVTSVPSRATRRAVNAPVTHMRARPGRGVVKRERNM